MSTLTVWSVSCLVLVIRWRLVISRRTAIRFFLVFRVSPSPIRMLSLVNCFVVGALKSLSLENRMRRAPTSVVYQCSRRVCR
jgi:hypothetical protein